MDNIVNRAKMYRRQKITPLAEKSTTIFITLGTASAEAVPATSARLASPLSPKAKRQMQRAAAEKPAVVSPKVKKSRRPSVVQVRWLVLYALYV